MSKKAILFIMVAVISLGITMETVFSVENTYIDENIDEMTEEEAEYKLNNLLYTLHKEGNAKEEYKEFIDMYHHLIPHIYESMDKMIKKEVRNGNPYNGAIMAIYLALIFNDIGDQNTSQHYIRTSGEINQMMGGSLSDWIPKVRKYYYESEYYPEHLG